MTAPGLSTELDAATAVFAVDHSRCIGCGACVQACAECDTHRGVSLIHLDTVDRSTTTQTVPMVCVHCEDSTCAEVCPADAIKQNEDGVVQSSLKPRCIGDAGSWSHTPSPASPSVSAVVSPAQDSERTRTRRSVGRRHRHAGSGTQGSLRPPLRRAVSGST